MQIALVNLLESFGIKPSAVIGHSSGEIAAAYVYSTYVSVLLLIISRYSFGALSLADACRIAYFRGIYAAHTADINKPCGMMAVGLGLNQAAKYLKDFQTRSPNLRLCIACFNSPKNVTISGLAEHLRILKDDLDTQEVFAQVLQVKVAYHSPYMSSIAEEYRASIGSIEGSLAESGVVYYSTSVNKEVFLDDLRSADYWVNNLLSPVLFTSALEGLCQSKHPDSKGSSIHPNVLIEIGPHSALRIPIQQTLATLPDSASTSYYPSQIRNGDSSNTFLQLLGTLHCLGYSIEFDANDVFGSNPVCLSDLPEYEFNHTRSYWHESRLSKNFRFRKYPASDLLGVRVPDWNPLYARWRNIITTLENPWIEDHLINGTPLYPGAGQLVMAVEASAQYARDTDARNPTGFCLRDVAFIKSLNISLDPEGVETQISLIPLRDSADRSVGWSEFKVCIFENEEWAETCNGQIMVEYEEIENEIDRGREKRHTSDQLRKQYKGVSSRCTRQVSTEKVYRRLNDYGLELGSTFKVFEEIRHNNEHEAVARIRLRQWTLRGNPLHNSSHYIHPTALDGVLQLGIVALSNCGNDDVPTMVPSRVGKLWLSARGLSGEGIGPLRGCAKSAYRGYRQTHMDIIAMDQTAGSPQVVVEGLETIIIGNGTSQSPSHRRLCYRMAWKPVTVDSIPKLDSNNNAESNAQQEIEAVIIISKQSSMQRCIADRIKHLITVGKVPGCKIASIVTFADACGLSPHFTSIYIFLPDLELFSLSQIDEDLFLGLQHIVSSTKTLFWAYLSPQSSQNQACYLSGDVQGLARTLRSEYKGLKFVTMGFEINASLEDMASIIIEIVDRTVSAGDNEYEPEYLQSNGMLLISRLIEEHTLNETISKRRLSKQHESRPFGSHPALKLGIGTPGLLDTLQFEQDDSVTMPLRRYEIEVKPKYCGVNFMDCLVALGRVPHTTLGVECAGLVLRAGEDTDLRPGDRVMLCASGTVKSLVRCHYNTAVKIPDNIPLEEAAALPATAATVYHALHNISRLQAGETILIHAGAGATGQLAIQMAINLQAVVFVTVGSIEKKILVMEQYNIPEGHIFYSRDTSFANGIKRVTAGRGVDVVLNSLAGDSLVASWECIAAFGRFIEIGKRDIYSHKQLPMFPFAKNVTFSTIDLAGIWEDRPALMRQILNAVVKMVTKKKVKVATPLNIFPVSNVEAAFRMLQSGKNIGKVVLELQSDAQVLTYLKIQPRYMFDGNASYVISGGLGGLGKSAAKWMVERGAKHLLLLSRSGPKTAADNAFISGLEAKGVHTRALSCDITDLTKLSKALDDYSIDMPPIKGCIQAAMVLQVSLCLLDCNRNPVSDNIIGSILR